MSKMLFLEIAVHCTPETQSFRKPGIISPNDQGLWHLGERDWGTGFWLLQGCSLTWGDYVRRLALVVTGEAEAADLAL